MRDQPLKEIVTVSEMARMVSLSRARFYQLVKEGVFPIPSHNAQTKRPLYTRLQQQECMLIRRNNQGANGRAVLFYGRKTEMGFNQPRIPKIRKQPTTKDAVMDDLHHGLRQLGLSEVTDNDIRTALAKEYPDGQATVNSSVLLMTIFRHLRCQDSQDNVPR